MQKINNIVFDLGGVILNIDADAVVKHLAMRQCDAVQLFASRQVKELLLEFEKGQVSVDSFRRSMKRLVAEDSLNDVDFDFVWNSILLDFPQNRIDYLLELREKYRIFLLSNTNKLHYDKFVADFKERFGLIFDSLFEQTFYSFEMGLVKPDVEIFKAVVEQTGIVVEETLFVDDTKANIETAAAMGLQTLAIARNAGLDELQYVLSGR